MSEIWTDKESWATDMSPTAIFSLGHDRAAVLHADHVGGRGVPGVVGSGDRVGTGRGTTGVLPRTIPGPIFNLNLRLGPTYGQMKLFLRFR